MKNIKSNNIKFLLALSLAMLVSQCLFSQAQNPLKLKDKPAADSKADVKPLSSFNRINSTSLNTRTDFLSSLDASMLNDSNTQKNIDKNTGSGRKKEKSVFLGGLFSAVLPGSGEFYGGNFLKAAIFFGVEAASWGVYAYLQHKGDTKTTAFEAYADQFWSINKYAHWLKDQNFTGSGSITNPDEQNWAVLEAQIHQCEQQNFSHTLPDHDTQQFYELIGKYQPFQPGWTNITAPISKDPGPYNFETYRDPVFVNYAFSRQDANNFYDYANTSLYFVVLNHILSTADAIWTVSTFNKNLRMQTGFRMNRFLSPYTYKYENMPTFNMTVNF